MSIHTIITSTTGKDWVILTNQDSSCILAFSTVHIAVSLKLKILKSFYFHIGDASTNVRTLVEPIYSNSELKFTGDRYWGKFNYRHGSGKLSDILPLHIFFH